MVLGAMVLSAWDLHGEIIAMCDPLQFGEHNGFGEIPFLCGKAGHVGGDNIIIDLFKRVFTGIGGSLNDLQCYVWSVHWSFYNLCLPQPQ